MKLTLDVGKYRLSSHILQPLKTVYIKIFNIKGCRVLIGVLSCSIEKQKIRCLQRNKVSRFFAKLIFELFEITFKIFRDFSKYSNFSHIFLIY